MPGSSPDPERSGRLRFTTAPVAASPANGVRLADACGDVWESCADWYAHDAYGRRPGVRPRGPAHDFARVMPGASYLCRDSYRRRHRISPRSVRTPEGSTGKLGFRCAADA